MSGVSNIPVFPFLSNLTGNSTEVNIVWTPGGTKNKGEGEQHVVEPEGL